MIGDVVRLAHDRSARGAAGTTARQTPPALLNAQWGGRPADYEALRDCWLNRRRLEFLTERLIHLDLPEGSAMLEIGSGTGWLLHRLARRFPRYAFTGVDPDPTYVRYARDRPAADNEHHVVASGEDLGVLDDGYHVILSNDVLHHVASLEATMRAASAVALEGCRWLAVEPNLLNAYTFVRQRFIPGERNFVPRGALRVARANGWHPVGRRYLFLIPPFVKTPPAWMVAVERRLEPLPPLAGGVCIEWVRRGRPGRTGG